MYSVVTFGYFFSNSSSESVSQFMFGSFEPMCDTMTNRYWLSCASAEPVRAAKTAIVDVKSFLVSFIGFSSMLPLPTNTNCSDGAAFVAHQAGSEHLLHSETRVNDYCEPAANPLPRGASDGFDQLLHAKSAVCCHSCAGARHTRSHRGSRGWAPA